MRSFQTMTAFLDAHHNSKMKSPNVDIDVEARIVPVLMAGDVGQHGVVSQDYPCQL
jgi:hypothetical protein